MRHVVAAKLSAGAFVVTACCPLSRENTAANPVRCAGAARIREKTSNGDAEPLRREALRCSESAAKQVECLMSNKERGRPECWISGPDLVREFLPGKTEKPSRCGHREGFGL